ncbi:MAG: hypothetical protein VYD19_09850 [Myxococcota bacterium]|nr:hypothetical protein [Myxococcota bacterium]
MIKKIVEQLMESDGLTKLLQNESFMRRFVQAFTVSLDARDFVREQVEQLIQGLPLVSRDEVRELEETIERLQEQLEALQNQLEAQARRHAEENKKRSVSAPAPAQAPAPQKPPEATQEAAADDAFDQIAYATWKTSDRRDRLMKIARARKLGVSNSMRKMDLSELLRESDARFTLE